MQETNDVFRVAICDDDELDLHSNAEKVKAILDGQSTPHCLALFDSAQTLFERIEQGERFHLLLLDVIMPKQNGMELAKLLRKSKHELLIVFVSSNREMALCGYEVDALRYLAKPLNLDLLQEALLCAYQKSHVQKEIYIVTSKEKTCLRIDDIQYVETYGRMLRIVLTDRDVFVHKTLTEILTLLPEKQFELIHRSIVLNLAHVRSVRKNDIVLKSERVLPLSKHRTVDFEHKFVHYLQG